MTSKSPVLWPGSSRTTNDCNRQARLPVRRRRASRPVPMMVALRAFRAMRSHLRDSFELHVQLLNDIDEVLAIVDGT